MTLLLTPTVQKIKPQDVEIFLEADISKNTHKLKAENPQKDREKKNALDIYRALCSPLNEHSLDAIVKNTGLHLRDVIGQYWFKTPEGSYISPYYDTFHRIIGNRDIDPKHVAELINEFSIHGYSYNKGLVSETGGIVDGQHRLAALKYLASKKGEKNPFIFDILPHAGVEEIEKSNILSDDWDRENRLQSGIDLQLPAYQKIGALYYTKYKQRIALSEVIDIVCGGRGNKQLKEDFIKRKLVLDPIRTKKAERFIDKVVELYNSLYGEEKKIGNAWFRIMIKLYNIENFSYNRLIKAVNNKSSTAALDLKELTSQSLEILCRYILESYNHNLSTNRIRAKTWQDIKNIEGGYSMVDTISFE